MVWLGKGTSWKRLRTREGRRRGSASLSHVSGGERARRQERHNIRMNMIEAQARGGNFAGCKDALRRGVKRWEVVKLMWEAIQQTPHIKKQIEEREGVEEFINRILRENPPQAKGQAKPEKSPKTTPKNK